MELLRLFLRQSPRLLFIALSGNVLAGATFALFAAFVDEGLQRQYAGPAATIGFTVFCCLDYAIRVIGSSATFKLCQGALESLRVEISERILATDQDYLSRVGKSGLMTILTQDASSVADACDAAIRLLRCAAIICASLALVGYTSVSLMLVILSIVVVLIVFINATISYPEALFLSARQKLDALNQHMHDLIMGSRELQLNQAKCSFFLTNRLRPEASAVNRLKVQGLMAFEAMIGLGEMIFRLGFVFMIFGLPAITPVSQIALQTGTLVFLFMAGNIVEALQLIPVIVSARSSYRRVCQLARSLSEGDDESLSADLVASKVRVSLEGVSYTRDGPGGFVLGPFDLSIGSGEIVFITGRNGTGKTTLALIILGLLKPVSGTIRLNGSLVEHQDQRLYRAHFSAVFSDYHLFSDFVSPKGQPVTAEEASAILTRLEIAEKVSVNNGRLSTTDLSSGQRRRVALAAACLENRPILFLDEWAADQDPVFKDVFYTQILQELKMAGKGLIVISHDKDYFHCADRVVSLDGGRLKAIEVGESSAHEPTNA